MGIPTNILFLLEKAANEKSETENWLRGIFENLNLTNIWVVDVSLETQTEKGKSAKSPSRINNFAEWITLLVKHFECECFMITPMVLSGLNKKKREAVEKLAGFKKIPHPSTTNGRRPEFVIELREAIKNQQPKAKWDELTLSIPWLTKNDWCSQVLEKAKETPGTLKLIDLVKKLYPNILPSNSYKNIGKKTQSFADWFEERNDDTKGGVQVERKKSGITINIPTKIHCGIRADELRCHCGPPEEEDMRMNTLN